MVSMKEIAKKCNVSVATVSKALNGYSDIGEETRSYMIQKTASEDWAIFPIPRPGP